ncbi:proteasome adapter and scaffold protein ECM29-like [Artemia franciscana]|uniref:proteasome adapter and scaffold protein ECM29-like n=1 Tax=Artemia franciscana TaxID=6661 RepID=UPI0032DB7645
MDDNALLERILLLISMAETDEKLEILVSRFLLPVILKLDSQEEGVRKKVLEVLVHLNKRMKSRPLLQLPMNQLVECLVKKNNSSFVKNFVLTYVKMGFPRLGPDTQVNLLPSLIKSLEEIPEKQQNGILAQIVSSFEFVKIDQDNLNNWKEKFQLHVDSDYVKILLEYCRDLLLLPYGRNNGVDDDLIIRHALEFFDAAAVAAAKSTFLNKVLPGETCPRCAGNEATHSH